MDGEVVKPIREYREKHPEIDAIMKKFQISQEVYEKALASTSLKLRRGGPTGPAVFQWSIRLSPRPSVGFVLRDQRF